MKKLLYLTLMSFLLSNCSKSYIQVFDTETTNTKSSNGFWVFETDTIKVTYEFWASQGVMSFSVYNKLDKPIYIDWKNSSFIYNSNKLDYWVDVQQSALVNFYKGYYYKGPLIKPGSTTEEGAQAAVSTTLKPERITFIPPYSFYYRSQFYLIPVDYFEIDSKEARETIVPRNDNPDKSTVVYEIDYNSNSSPLKFRNFLAFSFSESTEDFVFIDNEFYLSSVKEMDYRHFRGKLVPTGQGHTDYAKPFKKKSSFYKRIDPFHSIEYNAN